MPRTGDGNFSHERLIARYNEDLGNDLGNLVNRSVSMLHRYRGGVVPTVVPASERRFAAGIRWPMGSATRVQAAFDAFDFRQAIAAVWELVTAANKYIDDTKPWEIAKAAKNGDESADARLDIVLADLIETIRLLAVHLSPFIPDGAAKIANQVGFELAAVGDDGVASRRWNAGTGRTRRCRRRARSSRRIEVEAEIEVAVS